MAFRLGGNMNERIKELAEQATVRSEEYTVLMKKVTNLLNYIMCESVFTG